MSCQICGRRSAPGARLCDDCYAARKRAYDATITQPLVMAGAGEAPRTLSRLRRSAGSPETKARRAAKKAKAAAAAAAAPTVSGMAAPASAGPGPVRSRSTLWLLLSIGIALAAIAGWYLPHRTQSTADPETMPPATASGPSPATAANPVAMAVKPPEANPLPAAIAPLPAVVEPDPTPAVPTVAKPAPPKRTAAVRPVVPETETPPAVEIVRMPPRPAVVPPPKPVARSDIWQEMKNAIGRCPADEFLARVVCEQRVRLEYCDGHWGQVPQCPGGPSVDHG
ncbi:MAG TPA: hypothetical protein VIH15_13685 [Casimicrobiaceae bacterium]|jgi:hypothetical protein